MATASVLSSFKPSSRIILFSVKLVGCGGNEFEHTDQEFPDLTKFEATASFCERVQAVFCRRFI